MSEYRKIFETDKIVIEVSPIGELHITADEGVDALIETYDSKLKIYIASENIIADAINGSDD